MGNLIFFVIPTMLIVNLVQNSTGLTLSEQWMIYFVGDKLVGFICSLSFFGKYNKKHYFILFFIVAAYICEIIAELQGVREKGTTFADIHNYILVGLTLVSIFLLTNFYNKVKWMKKLLQN